MAQASDTFLWSGEVDNLQGYLQTVPRNTKLKCSVTEGHNGHLWSVGADVNGLQQVIDKYIRSDYRADCNNIKACRVRRII